MKDYQKFAISNFRTGFDEAVEPWLLPRDAYQSMVNAHLYRGVLERIDGYQLYATMGNRHIMSLGAPNGGTKTFTITISPLPTTTNFFAYGTIVVATSAETFQYQSDGVSPIINLVGSAGGTGTVNIATGAVSITFNTAPPANTYSDIFFVWDAAPADTSAIMGIKQYYSSTGGQDVLVFDQKRMGIITAISGTLMPAQVGTLQGISEVPHDYYASAIFTGDAATVTFSGTLAGHPMVPGTVRFLQYTSAGVLVSTITDNGVGGLTGPGVTSGSINYLTGAYTITFTVAPASGNVFNATTGMYGDLFTGSISNFFTLANYQYMAFFTNSVDPIFYYDGVSIHYLNPIIDVGLITATAGVPNNIAALGGITKTLHLTINRDRLLLLSPTVGGELQQSTVYWSKLLFPLDFTNDEQEPADTSEPIRAFSFINTDLVVRFANSERILRYTGDENGPFRFDKTNSVWACDAPYSPINYDSWFSSVGRPAIVGSDGVNVKRVDEIIPDFTDPTRLALQLPVPFMSQTSIKQCYGERFDDIKEGWLCYNSTPNADESTVTASDNVLAFNYLDQTYAVYQFPFSCLGYGRIIRVPTWGTIFKTWEDMNITWDSYAIEGNALIDLAGDQFDNVYNLNDGNSLGDEVTPVLMSVVTKNFNPFIEEGELCRFGYLDLFVSVNQISTLRVQFYVNDQLYVASNGQPAGFYQETKLTFNPTDAMSPSTNQTKVWKRIYIGSVAKEHTIRLYQNPADFTEDTLDQPIYVHAIVLYMKPAGRIFN